MKLTLTTEMAHTVRDTLDAIYADVYSQLDDDATFDTLHKLDALDDLLDQLPRDAE